MKIYALTNTPDEPEVEMDATLESSSLSVESSVGETLDALCMDELKQKLANSEQNNMTGQNEKIKLYEDTIKDKNDLIKSLNTSIELMKETKEFIIGTLKDKSKTEEDKLRATIADLENKAKIYEAKLKEKDAKIAKYTSNVESCESTDAPIDFLSGSEWPNIKLIKIGDKKMTPFIVNSPKYGDDLMVILQRFDGSQNFNMNSCCYEKGFGNVSGEFWLGLESLHQLTSSRRHELCIELVTFNYSTFYAKYDNFVVGSKGEGYALKSLGDFKGYDEFDDLKYCMNGKFVYDTSRNYYWWFSVEDICCLTGKFGKWGRILKCTMLIRPKV